MLFQANCWNCGRQASETCSGCNAARYCSQFCQHKDWEGHHKVCAVAKKVAASVASSAVSAAAASAGPQQALQGTRCPTRRARKATTRGRYVRCVPTNEESIPI